jgi:predicted dehydrogenase
MNDNPPSETVNLALIGCGTQGAALLGQALRIEGVRFKAVADIWPYGQRSAVGLARTGGDKAPPAVYADYQEMLAKEKDLQAVIIATPDWLHAEQAVACLKAGLHVYCESPMALDPAGAREMILAARKAGRLIQVGHERRSDPRYIFCRDNFLLANEKVLGPITVVYGHWSGGQEYVAQWNAWRPVAPRWFPKSTEPEEALLKKYGYDGMDQFRNWSWFGKFGTGPLGLCGLGQLDAFNWFLGAYPKSVSAAGGLDFLAGRGWDRPDNVAALYEYDTPHGPVRAVYRLNWTAVAGTHFETFMGAAGAVEVSDLPAHRRFRPEGGIEFAPDENPAWAELLQKGILKERYSPANLPLRLELMHVGGVQRETFPLLLCAPPSETPNTSRFLEYGPHDGAAQNPIAAHVENFIDAVRGNAKLRCPGEDGYAAVVQVAKTYEALKTGKRETFKEEDFQT